MTIAFIHNNKAFLPELEAYINYFTDKGITCEAMTPAELRASRPDVAWHFMGTDRQKREGMITIHEYTSASVPPHTGIKNFLKKITNVQPDYRIFLNDYVRTALGFSDSVPFGYRDMGVAPGWILPAAPKYETDTFIYTGETENRGIERLLDAFAQGQMQDYSLLIISKNYERLSKAYARFSNIHFKGPLSHDEVKQHIMESQFAVNFMPNLEPYNRQTSTKLLEYAACKKKIITTDYPWIRSFQEKHGGRYFYLKDDLSNFAPSTVHQFEYESPDIEEWTWEKQIERSGVVSFLEKKFPHLSLRVS